MHPMIRMISVLVSPMDPGMVPRKALIQLTPFPTIASMPPPAALPSGVAIV